MRSKYRRIPSRTALNIAWGGHEGYRVARKRVHPGNVGTKKPIWGMSDNIWQRNASHSGVPFCCDIGR